MRLTNIALEAIRQHSPGIKLKLALALNCSEGSINRYIRDNDDNLTKVAALEVIRKESGLSEEQIFEKESA
jgi:adenosine/AMP kinase